MKRLKLSDILITIVIALVFGIIYKLWGPVYTILKPFGLHVGDVIYGMWFIAGTVAILLLRKPGVALLAETAAASGEFLVGSEYGLSVLLYGIVQGLGTELMFALFGYKRYTAFVAALGGIAAAVGSLVMDAAYGYVMDLALWNLLLLIGARLLGGFLIAGILAYFLVEALEKTGVTTLIRPASDEDYKALDQ
ncbi:MULTISPECIES: ECF transporter S component [unclassified Bacillus (in: firmicutes)]|uniref:ECF transporter S component n=1 Tax=unclassified Bacillus (in: firmicutes) TaxID=185979 RepID=UPI000BF41EF0|nr:MULTISPECIES: ECF transporter S component [unclassified Bacillus (in: firmicutes)]PFG12646.1 energy-coupling factor transport system substrate-specific component [Bacillus sp. es.036]